MNRSERLAAKVRSPQAILADVLRLQAELRAAQDASPAPAMSEEERVERMMIVIDALFMGADGPWSQDQIDAALSTLGDVMALLTEEQRRDAHPQQGRA